MNLNELNHYPQLNELADDVWHTNQHQGLHDVEELAGDSIADLHSKVAQLWSLYRADKADCLCDNAGKMKELGLSELTCLEEHLADIIIRILDIARGEGVDVAMAVAVKDALNKSGVR